MGGLILENIRVVNDLLLVYALISHHGWLCVRWSGGGGSLVGEPQVISKCSKGYDTEQGVDAAALDNTHCVYVGHVTWWCWRDRNCEMRKV